MTEFYPDSERNLLYTSLVGSGFKKTYYNFNLERPCSESIPADLFIVPNTAPDLYRATRYTHVLHKTENDIEADCAIGLYKKPECGLGKPQSPRTKLRFFSLTLTAPVKKPVNQSFNCPSESSNPLSRPAKSSLDLAMCPLEHYRDWETDRKSTRLNSSHSAKSRMPSSA